MYIIYIIYIAGLYAGGCKGVHLNPLSNGDIKFAISKNNSIIIIYYSVMPTERVEQI